jgi:predicted DNA repair protein MutK
LGDGLVHVVPKLLTGLSAVGTAAMLWVGGGILLHGLEELHLVDGIPHAIHAAGHRAGEAAGIFAGVAAWLVNALGAALVGLFIGGIIVAIVRRFVRHPEELIVD